MAVIVTDMEMPVSCNCCDFAQRLDNMRTFCVRKPFEVPTDDTHGKRPDYCPLKERKTAHWVFGNTMGHSWMKCSECCVSQSGQTGCWTYCPNCGAEMKGENRS